MQQTRRHRDVHWQPAEALHVDNMLALAVSLLHTSMVRLMKMESVCDIPSFYNAHDPQVSGSVYSWKTSQAISNIKMGQSMPNQPSWECLKMLQNRNKSLTRVRMHTIKCSKLHMNALTRRGLWAMISSPRFMKTIWCALMQMDSVTD